MFLMARLLIRAISMVDYVYLCFFNPHLNIDETLTMKKIRSRSVGCVSRSSSLTEKTITHCVFLFPAVTLTAKVTLKSAQSPGSRALAGIQIKTIPETGGIWEARPFMFIDSK